MDAKDLRTESALSELNNDGSKYSQNDGVALHCDRNKPYQDIGSNSLAKVDIQTTRPCAVIGPDRIVPPPVSSDAYVKKPPVEQWSSLDNAYHGRRPPEYPHKLSNFQNPTRNISPRQTFQENMQRIMVPPSYNSVKINDDTNFTQSTDRNNVLAKNIKLNVQHEAKFCDVPYTIYPNSNEQKNIRNPDMCLSSVNPNTTRTPPQGWPLGGVNIRPIRPYGAPELYQYQEYPNYSGPRPFVSQPNRNIPEEPSYVYSEPFYHQEGNIRFKPYPTVKERFPQQRYDYISNYANSFHPPPPFHSHKYELQKTIPPQHYPPYPPIKYIDRSESTVDGYQRNSQSGYNIPYHNQGMHSSYAPILGHCSQNKMHSYPPEGHIKPVIPSNKIPYDNTKGYIEYENVRSKMHPPVDSYLVNEMGRMHSLKSQVIMPNYPTLNINNIPPNTYYKKDNQHLKNYEYLPAHFRNMDPSLNNHNPMIRHGTVFSPTTLAMSPTDSSASNDTLQALGTSQEDCGYVSQSSTASIRSIDSGMSRIPNEFFRKYYDSRFGPTKRSSSIMSKTELNSNNNAKERKNLNLRQFLQTWNEGDEETEENIQTINKNKIHKIHEVSTQPNHEQLYVLGLVNVPSEELDKYEHIQKVSKLPENIKGYNHIELLNQFEEAIESSNMMNYKMSVPREYQTPLKGDPLQIKQSTNLVPSRPLSPLDVEAKISQSVIHKEVGCNFEIKPCSPKMLNVEVATPIQNIIAERSIEKVTNPVMLRSPRLNSIVDNVDCNMNRKDIINDPIRVPSCKMISTQYSNHNSMETMKNCYSLHDLESTSALCLASLPRLDNDIELNFPEVNQQFINANKADSSISLVNSIKDLPTLEELDQPDIQTNDIQVLTEGDVIKSPCVVDPEKEFTKLSKYRKNKKNLSDLKENLNATRTDSVIIKNPENSKTHEENTSTSNGLIQQTGIQNTRINLTSQGSTKNDIEKSLTVPNERKEKDTSTDIAIDFSLSKTNSNIDCKENELNGADNSIKAYDQLFEQHLTKSPMFCNQEDISDLTESIEYKKESMCLVENAPLEDAITNNAYLSPLPVIKKAGDESMSPMNTDNATSSSLLPIEFITPSTEHLESTSDDDVNKYHQLENNDTKNIVISDEINGHKNVMNNIESQTMNISNEPCSEVENIEKVIECDLDICKPSHSELNHENHKTVTENLQHRNSSKKLLDSENNSISSSLTIPSVCPNDIAIETKSDIETDFILSPNKEIINSTCMKSEAPLHRSNTSSGTVPENIITHNSENWATHVISRKVIDLNLYSKDTTIQKEENPNKIINLGQENLQFDSENQVISKGGIAEHSQSDGAAQGDPDRNYRPNNYQSENDEKECDASIAKNIVTHHRSDNIVTNNSEDLFKSEIDKEMGSTFLEKKYCQIVSCSNSSDMPSVINHNEEERNSGIANLPTLNKNVTNYLSDDAVNNKSKVEIDNEEDSKNFKIVLSSNSNDMPSETYYNEEERNSGIIDLPTINNIVTNYSSDDSVSNKSKDLSKEALDQKVESTSTENKNYVGIPSQKSAKITRTLAVTIGTGKRIFCRKLRSNFSKKMYSPSIQNLILFSEGTMNRQGNAKKICHIDKFSNYCVLTDENAVQKVEILSTFNHILKENNHESDVKHSIFSNENSIKETVNSSNSLTVENLSRVNSQDISEGRKIIESDYIICNKNIPGKADDFFSQQSVIHSSNELTLLSASLVDKSMHDATDNCDELNTFPTPPEGGICLNFKLQSDRSPTNNYKKVIIIHTDKDQSCHKLTCNDTIKKIEIANQIFDERGHVNYGGENGIPDDQPGSIRNYVCEQLETQLSGEKASSEDLHIQTKSHNELLERTYQNTDFNNIILKQTNKSTDMGKIDTPVIAHLTVSNNIVEREQVDEGSSCINEIAKKDQVQKDSSFSHEDNQQGPMIEQLNFLNQIARKDQGDTDLSCSNKIYQESPVDKKSNFINPLPKKWDTQSDCNKDKPEQLDNFSSCNDGIVKQSNEQKCHKDKVSKESDEVSSYSDDASEEMDNYSICSEEPFDRDHLNDLDYANPMPRHRNMQWHTQSIDNDDISEQIKDNSCDKKDKSPMQECENLFCNKTSTLNSGSSKRQVLKRSLSDSAVNVCMNNKQLQKESEENISFLWPFKRRKPNNEDSNLLDQDLCSIIQCNRRNSVSSFYKEENVSFCILIDDSCIIAEENDEQEKICYTEITDEVLNEIHNDYMSKEDNIDMNIQTITTSQQENNRELDSYMIQDEEEKLVESWVEDVGCVETIINDDIAENVEISGPSSPKDDYLSDNDESGVFSSSASGEHTDIVKYIYGEKMCNDDAQLVETLYNTPQMDVNKTLIRRESLISAEYYDNDSLEKILSDSNDKELLSYMRDYTKPVLLPKIMDNEEIMELERPGKEIVLSVGDVTANEMAVKNITSGQAIKEDKPLPETNLNNVFTYKESPDNTNCVPSSSPEVSSTTSEEKSAGILLKITNYNASNISQVDDISIDSKRSSCKFTEDKHYVQCHVNFPSHRPLLTKAAQKYIPPLKESMRDLKVKLSLPPHSLMKLKELKKSKEEPKVRKNNLSVRNSQKPKPKFEDVLKSIDEIQFKMHKEKAKKTKKSIPKVVIKKNENGSHYASTSSKNDFNPDLTGRKWQPWVFIEKNHFIDKMALKRKTKAIYSHRKGIYVLAEKFQKYKSVNSAKFVITPPISEYPSTGLKYTIRLKHNY